MKKNKSKNKIEWTEKTWNPTCGCTKISSGCKNCYAEKMAIRLHAMGVEGYENGFKFNVVKSRFHDPTRRKKPTTYFVCSMSDLFHKDLDYYDLYEIFQIMKLSRHHTFQILTKRAERMRDAMEELFFLIPKNIWLGVSVENREEGLPRVEILRQINAHVRFLSIEPLLEDLGKINLEGIDWVIIGGESGSNARPMRKEWVEAIYEQCRNSEIPIFFKQWGTYGEDGVKRSKKLNGAELNGKIIQEMPLGVSL